MTLSEQYLTSLCRTALEEDVGTGDATTLAIVPEDVTLTAHFNARQELVCCGLPVVQRLFELLDARVSLVCHVKDGDLCAKGVRMATVSGPARAILTGERVALNFLQRLSGVAPITRKYVLALGNSATKLLDTRKTTPGLRLAEKYAVHMGGGTNHRIGLYDMVMIKDNHREVAKLTGPDSIARAVRACREKFPRLRVEVEADTLQDVQDAVEAGADIVMFDNMTNDQMTQALAITRGRCQTEASGGITIERLPSMATLGLDFISVGALTHSAPAVDIGLDT